MSSDMAVDIWFVAVVVLLGFFCWFVAWRMGGKGGE